MLSPWLTALVGAITGTSIAAGSATGIGLGVAGGVLAGAGLGALGEGIRSAVSDSPFSWKGVGIGAGIGGATAGLGAALAPAGPAAGAVGGAGSAASDAAGAVAGSALEGVGTTAAQAGGPGIGSFLNAGATAGQGALDTITQFSQSFGPGAFQNALSSYGTAGELVGSVGNKAITNAAFGAATNPRDPLRGAAMGAAGGAVSGFGAGVANQLPVRHAMELLPSRVEPIAPHMAKSALDASSRYSSIPNPTMGQAASLGGVGMGTGLGSRFAAGATNIGLSPSAPQPPAEDAQLFDPTRPFPDYQGLYRYTRGGGTGGFGY